MKPYRLMIISVMAAALIACQPAATSTPELRAPIATAEPIATLEASTGEWQSFSSAEGGFSILLPAQPKEQRQPVNTATGSVVAIMYIAEVEGTAFGAGYSDFPGSAANADPPGTRSATVSSVWPYDAGSRPASRS